MNQVINLKTCGICGRSLSKKGIQTTGIRHQVKRDYNTDEICWNTYYTCNVCTGGSPPITPNRLWRSMNTQAIPKQRPLPQPPNRLKLFPDYMAEWKKDEELRREFKNSFRDFFYFCRKRALGSVMQSVMTRHMKTAKLIKSVENSRMMTT